MDSRISIPTDNIHKFYAIFGLVICISAATLFVIAYNFHHQETVTISTELAKLNTLGDLAPYQEAYKDILEKRLEIGASNKDFYMKTISAILAIGIVSIFFGFIRWHFEVQPKLDELTNLQIQKLKAELSNTRQHVPFHRRRMG